MQITLLSRMSPVPKHTLKKKYKKDNSMSAIMTNDNESGAANHINTTSSSDKYISKVNNVDNLQQITGQNSTSTSTGQSQSASQERLNTYAPYESTTNLQQKQPNLPQNDTQSVVNQIW